MANIGIDTDDLTLLAKDIDEMKAKLEKVKQSINSNFNVSKEHELFLDGFAKLDTHLETELNKMAVFKSKLEKYKNEIDGIEESYIEKFSDISIPNFIYNGSNLSIINPSDYIKKPEDNLNNTNNNTNNTNNTNNINNTNNANNANNTSTSSSDNSGGGVNMMGIIAGAVGAIGVGSAIAVAALSKDKEDKDKDKENEKVSRGEYNGS